MMPNAIQAARRVRLSGRALAAAILIIAGLAGPAFGQDPQIRNLMDRIERLQREVTDLQRTVYRGETPPPGAGAVGGENTSAQMLVRLQQLEEELRQLTGQVEELNYRTAQLEQKVDKVNADTDLRLRELEGTGGAALPGVAAVAPAGDAGAMAAPAPAPAPGAPTGEAQGAPAVAGGISPPDEGAAPTPVAGATGSPATPQVLGTISQSQLSQSQVQGPDRTAAAAAAAAAAAGSNGAPAPAPGGNQVAAVPAALGTPEEQYQHAYNLLRAKDYAGAESVLRGFIAQHPKHELAGNAQYWLGETYYVRKDYRQAAVAFAEGYQVYPTSPKAPDNLLKLGLALAQIGEKADACEAFAQLGRQFPNAQQSLKDRASRERQRIGCG